VERFIVVSTTVSGEDEAKRISRLLVDEKLAACAQRLRIASVYRWKGSVETADEYLVLAKSKESLSTRIIERIKSVHAYDVPEITVTPITGGHSEYLAWIAEETQSV